MTFGASNRLIRRFCLVAAASVAALLASGGWAGPVPPDRQSPTKPTVDGPKQTMILRPVFTFGATDGRTPRAKIRFRCAFDGSPLRPCARIRRPNERLGFGTHTLRVRALDLAGNASRTTSFSFRVIGVWDAAADFERAPRPANPGRDRYGNTTWFLRYSPPELVHTPAGYEVLPTFWIVVPGWETWVITPNWESATAGFNNGHIVLQPGKIDRRQNPIVEWRSPVSGTFRVHAALQLEIGCPEKPVGGVVWWLDHGSQPLQTGILAPGATTQFDLTTAVVAGESLYIILNDNADPRCDTTAVDLRIETT